MAMRMGLCDGCHVQEVGMQSSTYTGPRYCFGCNLKRIGLVSSNSPQPAAAARGLVSSSSSQLMAATRDMGGNDLPSSRGSGNIAWEGGGDDWQAEQLKNPFQELKHTLQQQLLPHHNFAPESSGQRTQSNSWGNGGSGGSNGKALIGSRTSVQSDSFRRSGEADTLRRSPSPRQRSPSPRQRSPPPRQRSRSPWRERSRPKQRDRSRSPDDRTRRSTSKRERSRESERAGRRSQSRSKSDKSKLPLCERCEKAESAIVCYDCGSSTSPLKYCMDCASVIHQGKLSTHRGKSIVEVMKEEEAKHKTIMRFTKNGEVQCKVCPSDVIFILEEHIKLATHKQKLKAVKVNEPMGHCTPCDLYLPLVTFPQHLLCQRPEEHRALHMDRAMPMLLERYRKSRLWNSLQVKAVSCYICRRTFLSDKALVDHLYSEAHTASVDRCRDEKEKQTSSPFYRDCSRLCQLPLGTAFKGKGWEDHVNSKRHRAMIAVLDLALEHSPVYAGDQIMCLFCDDTYCGGGANPGNQKLDRLIVPFMKRHGWDPYGKATVSEIASTSDIAKPTSSASSSHASSSTTLTTSTSTPSIGKLVLKCKNTIDECQEPLLGLEYIVERQPWIAAVQLRCELCDITFTGDVTLHVTHADHKLKVYEKHYPSVYEHIKKTSSPGVRDTLVVQYAKGLAEKFPRETPVLHVQLPCSPLDEESKFHPMVKRFADDRRLVHFKVAQRIQDTGANVAAWLVIRLAADGTEVPATDQAQVSGCMSREEVVALLRLGADISQQGMDMDSDDEAESGRGASGGDGNSATLNQLATQMKSSQLFSAALGRCTSPATRGAAQAMLARFCLGVAPLMTRERITQAHLARMLFEGDMLDDIGKGRVCLAITSSLSKALLEYKTDGRQADGLIQTDEESQAVMDISVILMRNIVAFKERHPTVDLAPTPDKAGRAVGFIKSVSGSAGFIRHQGAVIDLAAADYQGARFDLLKWGDQVEFIPVTNPTTGRQQATDVVRRERGTVTLVTVAQGRGLVSANDGNTFIFLAEDFNGDLSQLKTQDGVEFITRKGSAIGLQAYDVRRIQGEAAPAPPDESLTLAQDTFKELLRERGVTSLSSWPATLAQLEQSHDPRYLALRTFQDQAGSEFNMISIFAEFRLEAAESEQRASRERAAAGITPAQPSQGYGVPPGAAAMTQPPPPVGEDITSPLGVMLRQKLTEEYGDYVSRGLLRDAQMDELVSMLLTLLGASSDTSPDVMMAHVRTTVLNMVARNQNVALESLTQAQTPQPVSQPATQAPMTQHAASQGAASQRSSASPATSQATSASMTSAAADGLDKKRLYLCGFLPTVRALDLRKILPSATKIDVVPVASNRTYGFAFAHFETEEEAERVRQELNGAKFQGCTLQVKFGKMKSQMEESLQPMPQTTADVALTNTLLSGISQFQGRQATKTVYAASTKPMKKKTRWNP